MRLLMVTLGASVSQQMGQWSPPYPSRPYVLNWWIDHLCNCPLEATAHQWDGSGVSVVGAGDSSLWESGAMETVGK